MQATLTDITVRRKGRAILGPLDLDLAPDGMTVVLGPNGAGKTTLLKVLHGVERLSSGQVQWSAPDASARPDQAYVFQAPIMLRRTVRQNLSYPLELVGTPKAELQERIATWADKIDLTHALDQYAPRLSGGEKQRLALGRALIRDPKVLFLDEPSASLDGHATQMIESLLHAARAQGTRIIMATHNLGQARRLADDIIFLHNGSVAETAPASQFFDHPQTAAARAFLAGDIVL